MRLAQGVGDLLGQQAVPFAGQRSLHARGLQQRFHSSQARGGVAQQNNFVHKQGKKKWGLVNPHFVRA
jgi:hypothetical protein